MKGDLTADTSTYLRQKSVTKDLLRCLDLLLSKIFFLLLLFCYSDAPEKVWISGPEKSSRGSSLLLECRSSPGVPVARLRWRLWRHEPELASGGHSDAADDLEAESTVEEEENGGLTASSWLTLQAGTGGEHQV
jgi:hypothetical protein